MSNIAQLACSNWAGAAVQWNPTQGAAGDGQNATWRIPNGPSGATRFEMRMNARDASKGARRVYRTSAVFPHFYTDTNTGLVHVHCITRARTEFDVDTALPSDLLKDYASLYFTALADKAVGGILEAIAIAQAAPR